MGEKFHVNPSKLHFKKIASGNSGESWKFQGTPWDAEWIQYVATTNWQPKEVRAIHCTS